MEKLFQVLETGEIVPTLVGPADGVKVFTLEEAAPLLGLSTADAEAVWLAAFGELLKKADSVIAAPVPPERAREHQVHLAVFKAAHYPEVPAHIWEAFLEFCALKKLEPRAGHILLRYTPADPERNLAEEAVYQCTIEGFRAIAHATGKYGGCDEGKPEHDGEGRLVRMTVTVTRLVDCVRCLFSSYAKWEDYYGWSGEAPLPGQQWKGVEVAEGTRQMPRVSGTLAQRMPDVMLGKCAEAAALRKAFTECALLYTPEELAGPRVGGRSAGGSPAAAPEEDETPVVTRGDLELKMVDLGVGNPVIRKAIIAKLRDRLRIPDEDDRFWPAAWRTLRANPQAFGVTRP